MQLIQKVIWFTTQLFCVCGVFVFCLFICFGGFLSLFVFCFVCLFNKSVSKILTSQILTWIRFKLPTEQLPYLFRADMWWCITSCVVLWKKAVKIPAFCRKPSQLTLVDYQDQESDTLEKKSTASSDKVNSVFKNILYEIFYIIHM